LLNGQSLLQQLRRGCIVAFRFEQLGKVVQTLSDAGHVRQRRGGHAILAGQPIRVSFAHGRILISRPDQQRDSRRVCSMVILRWLFSIETSLWVIGLAIGAGLTMALAPTIRNVRLAHPFFLIAAIWALGIYV